MHTLQVYSSKLVFEAWGHFFFVFHWVAVTMVLLRAILPKPRSSRAASDLTNAVLS